MLPPASVHLRRAIRASAALVVLAGLGTIAGTTPRANPQPGVESPFLVKPYLQLGDLPRLSSTEPVRVLWQARERCRPPRGPSTSGSATANPWRAAIATGGRLVGSPGTPLSLFSVPLTQARSPAREFDYRVSKNGEVVFTAGERRGPRRISRTASRSPVTPAPNTDQEQRVVYQMHRAQPDFFAIAGDIVYSTGRMVEYREKYFPIYNADVAEPRDRRSAHPVAPVVRRLRQSRCRHRRSRTRSRRSGVLPDLGVSAERSVYASPGCRIPRCIKGPPDRRQDPPRGDSVDLSPDVELLLRLRQLALDVSRFERLRRLVGCRTCATGWRATWRRRADATWKFVVFHHPASIRRARISASSRCGSSATSSSIAASTSCSTATSTTTSARDRSSSWPGRRRTAPSRCARSYVIDGDFEIDDSFDGVTDTTPDGVHLHRHRRRRCRRLRPRSDRQRRHVAAVHR